MPKVYVASSWRNSRQPEVVAAIREAGFEVYDFRNAETAFEWREIDLGKKYWGWGDFRRALEHPIAEKGFDSDFEALERCDCCVLLLPCGKSAHLEFGYAVGLGKATFILVEGGVEPELMYRAADKICLSLEELIDELECFFLLDLGAEDCR